MRHSAAKAAPGERRYVRSGACAIALALLATLAGSLDAQVVRGVLRESGSSTAIAGGVLSLLDTAFTVVTRDASDAEGRFELEAPGPGTYLVRAEQYGYRTSIDGVLDLGPGGEIDIIFYVVPEPIRLPGITAEAARALGPAVARMLENQGFYHRRKYLIGQFITPEDIARNPPMDWSQLFQRQAGVRAGNGRLGAEVCFTGRGGADGCCRPVVYVNGILTMEIATVSPDDIAAVEIYRGVARVPVEYGGMLGGFDWADAKCGVLLLWTKM